MMIPINAALLKPPSYEEDPVIIYGGVGVGVGVGGLGVGYVGFGAGFGVDVIVKEVIVKDVK